MPARRPGSRLQRLLCSRASLSSSLEPVRFPVPLLIDTRPPLVLPPPQGREELSPASPVAVLPRPCHPMGRVVPAGSYRWDRTPFGCRGRD